METYHVYHDCGKPFCLEIDSEGKKHFKNHSQISYDIFNEVFVDIPNKELIAKFILHDMTFHKCSMEEIDTFIKENTKEFCLSLWLTSFAELYANKEMFDDNNQTSFKIKYKKLMKVFKKLNNATVADMVIADA